MRRTLAYIIGVALGDGNLSNPNGRAMRLRITCDARYPRIAQEIIDGLKALFPENSVSVYYRPNKSTYFNISVYSNKLATLMPWKVGEGTKEMQSPRIPQWVRDNDSYARACIRGLIQTDGSIYQDRGYVMINFTNNIESLATDVKTILGRLGYRPTISRTHNPSGSFKYTVRVARDAQKLIRSLDLFKA